MATYSAWKPVVNVDAVRAAQRQRAVFGREPQADDPQISDAFMATRNAPVTQMNIPIGTSVPVAKEIMSLQAPDPSNVPLAPAQVRQSQGWMGGPISLNDAQLRQDLGDRGAWTASTENAPGTARVASTENPVFTAARHAGESFRSAIGSGTDIVTAIPKGAVAVGTPLVEGALGIPATATQPAIPTPVTQGNVVSKTAPSQPAIAATPNFMARSTDVLPQELNSGSARGVMPTDAQIAQARADAQAFEGSKTAQQARGAEAINAETAALHETNRQITNLRDGRSADWTPEKADDPEKETPWTDALEDYASGKVGFPGYKMVRNLIMQQERAAEKGQKNAPDGMTIAAGLAAAEQKQSGRKDGQSFQDVLGALNFQRGAAKDQADLGFKQADLRLRARAEERQAESAANAEARLQNKDMDAETEAIMKSWPQQPQLAAFSDSFPMYAAAAKKRGLGGNFALQNLAGTMQVLSSSTEKTPVMINGSALTEAELVALAGGTHEQQTQNMFQKFFSSWGADAVAKKRQEAIDYIQSRALGASRG
jgi:hypothetical protein